MSASEGGQAARLANKVILQRALDTALAACPALIKDVCTTVTNSIGANGGMGLSVHANQVMGEALVMLKKHRARIESAFPTVFKAAMDDAHRQAVNGFIQGAASRVDAASAVAPIRFQSLELMGDAQVQDKIESARALQRINSSVESLRSSLDTLVSSLLGHASIAPSLNPLRVEVFLGALQAVFAQTPASAEVRRLWVNEAVVAVTRAIKAIYSDVVNEFKRRGIKPVGFVVRKSVESGPGGGGGGGGAGGAGGAGNAHAGLSNAASGGGWSGDKTGVFRVAQFEQAAADVGGPLSHGVNAPSANSRDQPSPLAGSVGGGSVGASSSLTVDHLRRVLNMGAAQSSQMNGLGAVGGGGGAASASDAVGGQGVVINLDDLFDVPIGFGHANAAVEPEMDPKLIEQVALEAMRVMVESIALDDRLLEPLRKLILRLEPSLAELVRVDLLFFSDEDHPARCLLDELCQRGLAHTDEQSEDFLVFMRPMPAMLRHIEAQAQMTAQVFADALGVALAVWNEQDLVRERQAQAAVDALLRAERRDEYAAKVLSQVMANPETKGAPIEVVEFLTGPWARVIAQLEFESVLTGADSQRYRAVIDDLLWSTKVEEAGKNRNRLVRLVPPMVASLRAGLATIEYSADQQQSFFGRLMGWHEQALRPVQSGQKLMDTASAPLVGAGANTAWVAQDEVRESGFLAETERTSSAAESANRSNALVVGVWVELSLRGQWVRAQLNWMSPLGKLYMFTDGAGGAHSMSRRSLDRMFDSQGIRMIAQRKVTERALDAVADRAVANSVAISQI